jgi:chromate transporter
MEGITNRTTNASGPATERKTAAPQRQRSALEVLLVFLKLGVSCFGGPIAHIGYFREEFVVRRRWLDEHAYADLVALCQFLPGPASSQVGFSIGLMRAGYLGGFAAWTGFTLPSAIVLVLFAFGAEALSGTVGNGLLHGLKLVAVAIVAQAVWGMARTLCPDRERASIAVIEFSRASCDVWRPFAIVQSAELCEREQVQRTEVVGGRHSRVLRLFARLGDDHGHRDLNR